MWDLMLPHGPTPAFELAVNAGESATVALGGTVSERKGFTLTETLIAIVIVSLLVLMGYPKLTSAMVTTNVRGARTTIVNMVSRARAAAVQGNRRSAQVEFVGNNVLVTATPRVATLAGSTKDTVGSVQNLNAIYGVTVNSANLTNGTITFDPRGIGGGFVSTGSTVSVTKSGKSETITIDKLGRVQ
jgi:prepilin-type N-terminal cleavage/methylation domain-containing protein